MNGFFSPSKGELTLSELVLEIGKFIMEKGDNLYRLIIGTDSQIRGNNGSSEIFFVTAVVIHRIGLGGRYFWSKEKRVQKMFLRDRIYTETLLSLSLAENLIPLIRKAVPDGLYDLEIHIDVGPNGATRDMIKEVVGMVSGNGYVAKTKPESYGAYVVADRHT
ncbi:MAG: ribonuclease H-like YkuK family protein [Patescibacteria group bacterium]